MAKKAYVRRYSQAVFELALERNELDRWQSDLGKLVVLSREPAFLAALESPKIRLDDKVKILSEQLAGVNPLVLNLAGILVSKRRFSTVSGIAEDYRRLVDTYRGIEQAEVMTAVPIDDADKQVLEERLSAVTGKKVVLKAGVDSSLVGGVVARIGGKLLDGSTRSKLQALKSALAKAG